MKKFFTTILNLSRSLLLLPARCFFYCTWLSSIATVSFLFFASLFLFLGLYLSERTFFGGAAFFILLFWWCLGISFLNHQVYNEKKQIIEGFLREEDGKLSDFGKHMTLGFLIVVHIYLLWTLSLLLREISILTGDTLFKPKGLGVGAWSIYAIDLIFKAVLFDIPEIYHLDLISIEHIGFIGSTIVFLARLIILVLVLGSFLKWWETRQILRDNVGMLDKHPEIAQTKILIMLRMYPGLLRQLSHYSKQDILPSTVRVNLIETIGKSRLPEALGVLESHLSNPSLEIKLAAVRGMGHLGFGRPSILLPVLEGNNPAAIRLREEICRTLGLWRTVESTVLLARFAENSMELSVRLSAIESLGKGDIGWACPILVHIMRDGNRTKEERFAAKNALIVLGKLTELDFESLKEDLMLSPHPDNRRFAAMVLGGIEDFSGSNTLMEALIKDNDPDTRTYCAKGLGELAHKMACLKEVTPGAIHGASDMLSILKKSVSSDTHPFVRVACIHSLVDMAGLLKYGLESFGDVPVILQNMAQSSDTQISDAAADALQRLSPYVETVSFERRRESITAIAEADISPRASIPPQSQGLPQNEEIYFERYKPEEVLWTGEISQVIIVRDLVDSKVKILKRLVKEQFRDLFLNEIKILSKLNHPSIIPVLEQYQTPPAFTMPFLSIPTLLQEINNKKNSIKLWMLNEFLNVMKSLCTALRYLEEQGIVHRDIKPENLLYQKGNVILLDFSIARYSGKNTVDEDRRATTIVQVSGGTPFYMAPEQMTEGSSDNRTDIYAAGVIGYELLTGRLPCGVSPTPVHKIRQDIPSQIHTVLVRATSFNQNDRYLSAKDFWTDIKKASENFVDETKD